MIDDLIGKKGTCYVCGRKNVTIAAVEFTGKGPQTRGECCYKMPGEDAQRMRFFVKKKTGMTRKKIHEMRTWIGDNSPTLAQFCYDCDHFVNDWDKHRRENPRHDVEMHVFGLGEND